MNSAKYKIKKPHWNFIWSSVSFEQTLLHSVTQLSGRSSQHWNRPWNATRFQVTYWISMTLGRMTPLTETCYQTEWLDWQTHRNNSSNELSLTKLCKRYTHAGWTKTISMFLLDMHPTSPISLPKLNIKKIAHNRQYFSSLLATKKRWLFQKQ